ncbi:PrgU family protein, partial [Enterococcus faecalis]|uniref:PrgU family protein n=1 Tax=Enterococcus faecalis TaxID=1351 RepID=UPI003B82798D
SSFLLLSFSIILPYLIVDLKLCNRTQEITTLNIIKNGKSLALEVYPEKSIYVKPNLGRINVPVFFIKTPINRGIFEEIFGETLKA